MDKFLEAVIRAFLGILVACTVVLFTALVLVFFVGPWLMSSVTPIERAAFVFLGAVVGSMMVLLFAGHAQAIRGRQPPHMRESA